MTTTTADWRPPQRAATSTTTTMPGLTPAFCDAGARYLALASLEGEDVSVAYAQAATVLEDLAATVPDQFAGTAQELLDISEQVASSLEGADSPSAQGDVIKVAEAAAAEAGVEELTAAITQCPEAG